MKWSDGEPLTAEDVKYTIDRANEEEWNSHISITANLTAEVVDEHTLGDHHVGARPSTAGARRRTSFPSTSTRRSLPRTYPTTPPTTRSVAGRSCSTS